MSNLRFLTSGESHGKALIGILEGIPSGFSISSEDIDKELRRRQGGYGRGGRMKIESDHAEILSGIRRGKTIGSPIAILIENKDWENWQEIMSSEFPPRRTRLGLGRAQSSEGIDSRLEPVTRPRPGHADLAGALKYDHKDIRNVLERSSARETAMRVALGAMAKRILSVYGIRIGSYVIQIGKVRLQNTEHRTQNTDYKTQHIKELFKIFEKAEESPVRCPDRDASKKMVRLIDKAVRDGNSLGGIFEVFLAGLPIGLGSHVQWDRKLDGRLAQAVMSIQAIKGVEIGLGFEMAGRFGSEVMDEIFYRTQNTEHRTQTAEHRAQNTEHRAQKTDGFYRKTNNAGGIEGGISNGMPIIIRAAMKPIPTLKRPLMSIDINTKKPFRAVYERSDVCAVPAAAVVAEAMAALVVADAFLEKFGGDSKKEVTRNFNAYISYLNKF